MDTPNHKPKPSKPPQRKHHSSNLHTTTNNNPLPHSSPSQPPLTSKQPAAHTHTDTLRLVGCSGDRNSLTQAAREAQGSTTHTFNQVRFARHVLQPSSMLRSIHGRVLLRQSHKHNAPSMALRMVSTAESQKQFYDGHAGGKKLYGYVGRDGAAAGGGVGVTLTSSDKGKKKERGGGKPVPVDFSLLRGAIDRRGVEAPQTDLSSVENLVLQADWVSAVRESAFSKKLTEYGIELKKKQAIEAAQANAAKAVENQKLEEAKKLDADQAEERERQAKEDQKLFDTKVAKLLPSFDASLMAVSAAVAVPLWG
jgi:hypothetical protein